MSQPSPAPPRKKEGTRPSGPFARLLSAMHRHPWPTRIGVIVYAAAVTFPHSGVQWVANQIASSMGHAKLYRVTGLIFLLLAAIVTALVGRTAMKRAENWRILGLWVLTAVLILGAWAGLTANNLELVHYPQYFPEGIIFLSLTLAPAEALSWVTIFGGLDEAYQYWLLPRTRVSLFDFNDIYMDLLGGAAGVVFAMAFLGPELRLKLRSRREQWTLPGVVAILSIIGLGAALWAAKLMLIVRDKSNPRYWFALGDFRAPSFWAHVVENGPKHYHTLTPFEGVLLILATVAIYGRLSGKTIPD